MKKDTLIVEAAALTRLDRYLAGHFPEWSRTRLQRLVENNSVLLDGKPAACNTKIKNGQTITISWPEPKKRIIAPRASSTKVPVIFEDKQVMVINKPAGLVVHPSVGHHDGNTLVEIFESRLSPKAVWPDNVRPGLVHRLDRDTSGVVVMAKSPEVQMNLSKQFSLRQVKKTYLGLVLGRVKPNEGTLESHLARHPGQRQRYAVVAKGRWALTKFKVIERLGDKATILELYPLTGRTHQIRVQVASFGHPIVGDYVYGPSNKDKQIAGVTRHMLHAAQIEFTHPAGHERKRFSAPLPDDFQSAIKLIRLKT